MRERKKWQLLGHSRCSAVLVEAQINFRFSQTGQNKFISRAWYEHICGGNDKQNESCDIQLPDIWLHLGLQDPLLMAGYLIIPCSPPRYLLSIMRNFCLCACMFVDVCQHGKTPSGRHLLFQGPPHNQFGVLCQGLVRLCVSRFLPKR